MLQVKRLGESAAGYVEGKSLRICTTMRLCRVFPSSASVFDAQKTRHAGRVLSSTYLNTYDGLPGRNNLRSARARRHASSRAGAGQYGGGIDGCGHGSSKERAGIMATTSPRRNTKIQSVETRSPPNGGDPQTAMKTFSRPDQRGYGRAGDRQGHSSGATYRHHRDNGIPHRSQRYGAAHSPH